ncbi:cellulose biosynthesis cyclic di-GMP-binding regulatory protein BcsB [Caminicella sporogenes]|uniref:cellulose biosynthesis cyclic di-GMP-binding regulatory protein BcsB n=1 Tax=Caminicella sporogenes TaxID=166485 RepID=UPI002541BAB3|nr:cellulose biosynthesis cyclic di-GMP-binding regulatory protein BcsB [Caminicella sporogenes]WIF93969.1 cellulose biosynthesis cyclic di-GMP-binding regulatory protein BcsB [Caminicella sporogenes]
MKKIILFICVMLFLNLLTSSLFYSYADTNEKYVIQVGVFEKKFNADKVYGLLKENNFPVYMRKRDKFWIYVGQYDYKMEAEKVLAAIKQIGINGYVKKIYSKVNSTINVNNALSKSVKTNIKDVRIKSKNYHLNKDVKIDGVFGNYTFFIKVDKHWQIKNNAYFELIFSQSQIKKYKNSTLTVEINDFPLYSVLLYDKGVNRERIKVPIPLDKINEGYNEIKIKCYHRITDEPCADIINPANWIVFHKDSYVHIEFIEKQDKLSLIDYPYPYLKENSNTPINNVIIIPDNYHNYELNAAVILAANFGQRFPYNKFDTNVLKFSEAVDKGKSNIIYIGSRDNTPKEILSLISKTEINSISDKALIKEVISPYNSRYKILLILSDNKISMLKAVKVLSDDKMVLQMDKPYQFISNTININEKNISESEYISLEDLGYSNIKLQGIFYQKVNFGVNIPKDWIIKEGALLHIDMRYSEVLDFDRSLVTVYLNGIPIGSKKLCYENANNDVLEVKIPDEVKDSNYYNLEVVFYFELDSQECNYRRDSNSWAYISKQSYLYLPHNRIKNSFFENYESPFITNKKFNDLVIVVPENLSSYEMKVIASIVSALGRNVNSLENIEIKTSNESKDEFKGKNLIVIGTPHGNNLIKQINNQLYIKFDKDFSRFLSNDKLTLLEDYNKDLASLQLIKSPFDENRTALIITATKKEGLNWAKNFLTDFEFVTRLKGNAVIIDRYGNVQFQYYGILEEEKQNKHHKENVSKNEKQNIKRLILSRQIRNYIFFVISILLFIIISSVLIMRKKR